MSESFFPTANIGRLYPHAVASALNRDTLWEPSYAEFEDPEFFEKIQRDAEIARLLNYRCQLVASERWSLEPASDSLADRRLANFVRGLIKKIPLFQSRRALLARAFIRASTWLRINARYELVNVPGFGPQRCWRIYELKDVDKREFELQRNHEAERHDPERRRFWRWMLADKSRGYPEYRPIDLRDWVHHVYSDEERGLGHGTSIADAAYFLNWFKQEVMRNGMQFLARWSQGLLVYYLNTLKRGAKDTGTSTRRATDALALLNKIRAGNDIVLDLDEKVEHMDTPAGGWSTALEALHYLDEQASRLFLGSVTNTGGGTDKGSLARAETEKDSMEALIQSDRGMLDETISSSIVLRFVENNWALICSLGMRSASAPAFRSSGDKHSDPKAAVEMFSVITEKMPGVAAAVPATEFFDRIGVTPSAADEGVETLADLMQRGRQGHAEEDEPAAPAPAPDLKTAADLVGQVAAGQLPAESAVILLGTVFGEDVARAMVEPAALARLAPPAPQEPPANRREGGAS